MENDLEVIDSELMNEFEPESQNDSTINPDITHKQLKHPVEASKRKRSKLNKKIKEEAKEEEPGTSRDEIEQEWKELEGDY